LSLWVSHGNGVLQLLSVFSEGNFSEIAHNTELISVINQLNQGFMNGLKGESD